jgi:hypothetical protein
MTYLSNRVGTAANLNAGGSHDLLMVKMTVKGTFPEGQISFGLYDVPMKITGIQKVAQHFLRVLLSSKGSDPFYPNKGTLMPSIMIGANLLEDNQTFISDVVSAVKDASDQVRSMLNVDTIDLESTLDTTDVVGMDRVEEGWFVVINLVTLAGENASISVPFPEFGLGDQEIIEAAPQALVPAPSPAPIPPAPPPTLTISATPVTTGYAGSSYAGFSATGAGGTPPYTYSVNSAMTSVGLSINPTSGFVSGTMPAAGSYPGLVVTVIDSANQIASINSFTLISVALESYLIDFNNDSTGGAALSLDGVNYKNLGFTFSTFTNTVTGIQGTPRICDNTTPGAATPSPDGANTTTGYMRGSSFKISIDPSILVNRFKTSLTQPSTIGGGANSVRFTYVTRLGHTRIDYPFTSGTGGSVVWIQNYVPNLAAYGYEYLDYIIMESDVGSIGLDDLLFFRVEP